MTAEELELFAHSHFRIGGYWSQMVLPCKHEDCWYCTGESMKERYEELEAIGAPAPEWIIPPYASDGRWASLLVRQNAARSGKLDATTVRQLLEGSAIPESIVKAKFKEIKKAGADVTAVPVAVMTELLEKTLLKEKTITHLFEKWSGEIKEKTKSRAADDGRRRRIRRPDHDGAPLVVPGPRLSRRRVRRADRLDMNPPSRLP